MEPRTPAPTGTTTVTVHLTPDTERELRRRANQMGQTLETYLEQLAERETANGMPSADGGGPDEQSRYISDPGAAQAEFTRLLGDLAAGPKLPVLPADFSRTDIYDDHD